MVEKTTFPTRRGDEVEIRTGYSSSNLLWVKSAESNGGLEIPATSVKIKRYENHTSVWLYTDDRNGDRTPITTISMEHGVARRLAVWLSRHSEYIAE